MLDDSSHVPSFVFCAPWSAFILKPSFSIIILSCHLELSCSWLTFCLKCLSSPSCFSSRTSNSWFILIEECSDDNIFVIFQLCFCFSLHIWQLKVSSHFWSPIVEAGFRFPLMMGITPWVPAWKTFIFLSDLNSLQDRILLAALWLVLITENILWRSS